MWRTLGKASAHRGCRSRYAIAMASRCSARPRLCRGRLSRPEARQRGHDLRAAATASASGWSAYFGSNRTPPHRHIRSQGLRTVSNSVGAFANCCDAAATSELGHSRRLFGVRLTSASPPSSPSPHTSALLRKQPNSCVAVKCRDRPKPSSRTATSSWTNLTPVDKLPINLSAS